MATVYCFDYWLIVIILWLLAMLRLCVRIAVHPHCR